ncbi:uncharacterized protein LOC101862240, partial [Aplysia californica]|uniref:Uncharacterized protein LOC101862240 n=1 Tax=Aplysia californica TaxID=6500 RepID=A0ABM1AA23_APLCA
MSVMIMGVHLEEPTSPATDRWSGTVTSPVKSQWTDEDLDAFVRQLSNPQHQVTKIGSSSHQHQPQLDSPRKCSLDLCRELKDRDRVRAPLARSETDTSVTLGELASPTFEKGGSFGKIFSTDSSKDGGSASGKSGSGGGGLISGLSGLRLIKNKKLVRSSHANAKKSATQKSREDVTSPSPPSTRLHGAAAAADGQNESEARDVTSAGSVTFTCSSSPEGSDGEGGSAERRVHDSSKDYNTNGSACAAGKDAGKKRRFRKMLSRPLNRSQSAGCAKDVPAHALFMEQQRMKSKDAESVSDRKNRASEGDIRHVRPQNDEEDEIVDDEDSGTANSNSNSN